MKIKNYKLSLEIDFYDLGFRGLNTITCSGLEDELILDSSGLEIDSVSLSGRPLKFQQDRERKKVIVAGFSSRETGQEDELKIEVAYHGRVSEETLHGLYKSRYDGGYLIATDFEPNGARLVFPCVDDPKYKAEFDLEIITQKGLVVTSNTIEKETMSVDEKRSRHVFERTPPMSTYLFYFGIGNFEQSRLTHGDIEFRALTRPGQASKGIFALDHAAKFLQLYAEYYSIAYPFPKLDLIALPEYTAGAMENWGAITFREVALLVDENSSASNRRGVVEVLGHEIAHQWFGDLVTMEWWNDLWLNESFATFMESKMTDRLYPEWNIWSDFLQEMSGGAMLGDSLESTHPIDVDVKAPEEVSQIFDEISYGKGASILRMIEAWIGEDAFRDGVRKYLTQFSYQNARGSDLWKKLQEVSGKPASEVMEAWIQKPGYPVVKVSREDGMLRLTQERFVLRKSIRNKYQGTTWPIPIVVTVGGKSVNFLLSERSQSLQIEGSDSSGIKLNAGQTGFYRVLYDENSYSWIGRRFESLPTFDRWGIISDLFAFLVADSVSPQLYLDFIQRATNDAEYLVVDAVSGQLEFLRSLSPGSARLKEIYLDYHRKHIARLGLYPRNEEKDNDKILRGRIATGLALEDPTFAGDLAKRFREYDRQVPDIRTAVATSFALTNGEASFSELVAMMKKMGNEADVIKILSALASYHEPSLVTKSLDFCVGGEINRADSVYAIFAAAQNPHSRAVTWEWVTKNLETLLELFRGTPTVSFLLQEVIARTGIGREQEVRDYFSKIKIKEADKGITKGLELLDAYSDLAHRLSQGFT